MTKKTKAKTNWGFIIGTIIVLIVLGGGGYLFYAKIYPVFFGQTKTQENYNPPRINESGKDKLKDLKQYGNPIQDNEPAGRADPFAPI